MRGRGCSRSGGRRAMGLLRRRLQSGSWVGHWDVSWFEIGGGDWLNVLFWLDWT